MRVLSNLMMLVGAIGLGVMASIHLYDVMLTEDPATNMFTKAWWSPSWPVYAVMVALMLVGAVLSMRQRRA